MREDIEFNRLCMEKGLLTGRFVKYLHYKINVTRLKDTQGILLCLTVRILTTISVTASSNKAMLYEWTEDDQVCLNISIDSEADTTTQNKLVESWISQQINGRNPLQIFTLSEQASEILNVKSLANVPCQIWREYDRLTAPAQTIVLEWSDTETPIREVVRRVRRWINDSSSLYVIVPAAIVATGIPNDDDVIGKQLLPTLRSVSGCNQLQILSTSPPAQLTAKDILICWNAATPPTDNSSNPLPIVPSPLAASVPSSPTGVSSPASFVISLGGPKAYLMQAKSRHPYICPVGFKSKRGGKSTVAPGQTTYVFLLPH